MAELLIKARAAPDADPNHPMVYTSGDLVLVKPDGHTWGRMETVPDFWKVRITDRTVAQLEALAVSITDTTGNATKRRRYYATTTGMDPAKRDLMFSGGIPSFTWTEARKQILDKTTGTSV